MGPPLGRPAQGLPLAGLARRPRRGRPRGLPLDALLRLRRLHRLRHRARRRLGRAARRRQPGHRPGPRSRAARCPSTLLRRAEPVGGGRVRASAVRFTKLGKVRFTAHRDVARIWERALRRAELPVAYTEGFSPRPRLSFGLALSTGHESPRRVPRRRPAPRRPARPRRAARRWLDPSLPAGIDGAGGRPSSSPAPTSLQQAVTSCIVAHRGGRRRRRRRRATPSTQLLGADDAADHPSSARASEVTDDLRPAILAPRGRPRRRRCSSPSWPPNPAASAPRSCSRAARSAAATARAGCCRTHQWTSVDGARCEPIPFGDLGARGATSTPHAEARAS